MLSLHAKSKSYIYFYIMVVITKNNILIEMKHCVFCVYIQVLHYSKFLEGILN